jgi:cytochrome c
MNKWSKHMPHSLAPRAARCRCRVIVSGTILAVLLSPASRADNATLPAPLIAQRCNACHAMTDVLIGPPFLAVAARHSADADRDVTVEVLAYKIVHGGGGYWGVVPMVANDHVSMDEARVLARLILAFKP